MGNNIRILSGPGPPGTVQADSMESKPAELLAETALFYISMDAFY